MPNIFFKFKSIDLKTKIILCIFSLITCFINCFCSIYKTGYLISNFNFWGFIVKLFLVFIIFYFSILILTSFLQKFNSYEEGNKIDNKRFFFISFFSITLMWLIVFLAYYPGIFSYDVDSQLTLVETHHPLIHTLYLRFFYYLGERIGNINTGIAIATLIQMIFLSLSLSYLNLFLNRISIKKNILIMLISFEAIMPIYSILSISHTKDVFFTCFFLLLVTFLLKFIYLNKDFDNSNEKMNYFLVVIGFILFRNQSIFIIIIFTIINIISIYLRKKFSLIIKINIIAIIISTLILISLKIFTQATPTRKVEYLNIPLQGIARVYNIHYEELDESIIDEYNKLFIKLPDNYDPFLSDRVKMDISNNYESFLKIFKYTIVKYPYEYFVTVVLENMGYLYINDESASKTYGSPMINDYRSDRGLFLTNTVDGFGVIEDSKIKNLERLYESLFTQNKYKDIPIIKYILSMALYLYIILYSFSLALIKNKYELMNVFLFVGLFLGTIFLGPCSLMRYAFPYISVSLPLLIIVLCKNEK